MIAYRHTQSGFTLVELMIALLLGVMVIGGASAVFLSNKQSYRTTNALNRIQENSRIAFEMLTRDLRQARLTGCGNETTTANLLNNNTVNWYSDFANRGLIGFGETTANSNPALTTGTAFGNHRTGTDSIMLIGAADTPYSVSAHTAGTNLLTISETGPDLSAGDLIIVCDTAQADIAQITARGTSGAATTVTVATGGTAAPGNAAALSKTYMRNTQVTRLKSVSWYIGCNPVGAACAPNSNATSLYRMIASGAAGPSVTTQAEEMVRGVSELDITYHVAGTNSFVNADAVTSWAANDIDAVRIRMRMISIDQAGAAPIAREQTSIVALRNPPLP